MQTMSTAMATLLKSGKMIGDNRPTSEVIISSGSEGVYDWDNMTNVKYPDKTRDTRNPSFVVLSNGNVLYQYEIDGALYQSTILDLDTFTTQNDTATTGELIFSNKTKLSSNVFFDPKGNLYFVAGWLSDNGDRIAKVVIYKSDLKDGSDWTLYSTVYSFDWNSLNSDTGFAYFDPVGLMHFTEDGSWMLLHHDIYGYLGYPYSRVLFVKSTDDGLTWVTKKTVVDGYANRGLDISRNIADFKGYMYATLWKTTATGYIRFYRSNDNGDTWTQVITESGMYEGETYNIITSDSENLYYIGDEGVVYAAQEHPTQMSDFVNTGHLFGIDTNFQSGLFVMKYEDRIFFMTTGLNNYHDNTAPLKDVNMIIGIQQKSDIPLHPKSITISRAKGMSGGLTVEFDNKSGILAPDGTTNPQLLWPNKEVVVKQGYGEEQLTTFTGLIDSISMSTFPQSVTVSARDKMKALLDHYIRDSSFNYVVTYEDMTVEAIWQDLITKAGLTYNTVETTGLTISEKTFSWESYADAISWLDEISGFETYCDEDGLLNFVWDGRPESVTTAYSFVEGEDITTLGYEINDADLFYTVAVYGKAADGSVIYFARQFPQAEYWNIPSGKVMRIDAPDADTSAKCEIIADKAIYLMQTRARQVTFSTIGIPHLQRGDFIQVEESSTTISEIYRITDITTTQVADGNYTMTLNCYYHGAPEPEVV